MPKLGTIGMIPPYDDPLAEPDCKATDGRARAHGGTLRVIGVVPLGIWEWSWNCGGTAIAPELLQAPAIFVC